MKKRSYIHAMEYCLAMEGNGFWSSVAVWMDLEGVVLSGVCQIEKDRCNVILLISGI